MTDYKKKYLKYKNKYLQLKSGGSLFEQIFAEVFNDEEPEPQPNFYRLVRRDGRAEMVRQFGVLNAAEELPQPLQYYVDNAPSVSWFGRPPQQWINLVRASHWNNTYKISPDPDLN
jgi:hypothetical protein